MNINGRGGNNQPYTLHYLSLLQAKKSKDFRATISHNLKTIAYSNSAANKGFEYCDNLSECSYILMKVCSVSSILLGNLILSIYTLNNDLSVNVLSLYPLGIIIVKVITKV